MSGTKKVIPNLYKMLRIYLMMEITVTAAVSMVGVMNNVFNGRSWETWRIRHGFPIKGKMVTRGMDLYFFFTRLAE